MFPVNPLSQSDRRATQIHAAPEPSVRCVADVVCYFCGTLQSGCVVVRLAHGRVALDVRHSVAAGRQWRGGRPLCPRCGGAVYLEDVHTAPVVSRNLLAASSSRAAAA